MDTPISDELLKLVSIFSPNKTELERVLGSEFDPSIDAVENAKKLVAKYPSLSILLKQGEKGSTFIPSDGGV